FHLASYLTRRDLPNKQIVLWKPLSLFEPGLSRFRANEDDALVIEPAKTVLVLTPRNHSRIFGRISRKYSIHKLRITSLRGTQKCQNADAKSEWASCKQTSTSP
ncbi:MAG TPA: hypothetical protein VGQ19_16300, partial [Burkholderiales bacterium]|nr:hypothetical protein [Burkholderiales bacterium]